MDSLTPQSRNTAVLRIGGRTLARNTLLNLAGQVIPMLAGFATLPYVVRHLGEDRFGLLSLVWIIIGYFALFDFGIGPATTKFVAELLGSGEVERLPGVVWTALATQTSFGVVAGAVLAAISPELIDRLLNVPPAMRSEAHFIFFVLALCLPIGFATGTFQGVLGASQRFDLVNGVGIPTLVLYYTLPAIGLRLGYGLRGIVVLLVLGRVAALVGYAILSFRLHPTLWAPPVIHRSLVRPLLGFGGWVAVAGAVSPVLVYCDRFFMGALLSVAAVGIYTPPYMLATKLSIFPNSLAGVLFPAFSTYAGRGDHGWIRNTLARSLSYLLVIMGPVTLILVFFARPILTLWLGAGFSPQGIRVLQILAVGAAINSIAIVPYNLLQGMGRPDLNAKFHLIEIPIHLGLLWFLIRQFGLPGAAWAWSARVVIDFLLLMVASLVVTGSSVRLVARRALTGTLGMLAALTVALGLCWMGTHSLGLRILFAALLNAAFLAGIWYCILDIEERQHITNLLRPSRDARARATALGATTHPTCAATD